MGEHKLPKRQPLPSVFLAHLSSEKGVDTYFYQSIMRMQAWDRHVSKDHPFDRGGWTCMVSGPRIASGRNTLMKIFLDYPTKPDYMLMVDDDMVFEPDLLERTVRTAHENDLPVLGGLCFVAGVSRMYPTVYVIGEANEEHGALRVVRDYPRDQIVKVNGTGCAWLLIRRDVVEKVGNHFAEADGFPNPYPWFSDAVYKGREFGEDWTFCMRVQQMGFPIHLDTRLKVGHSKVKVYGEIDWDDYVAAGGDEEGLRRRRAIGLTDKVE